MVDFLHFFGLFILSHSPWIIPFIVIRLSAIPSIFSRRTIFCHCVSSFFFHRKNRLGCGFFNRRRKRYFSSYPFFRLAITPKSRPELSRMTPCVPQFGETSSRLLALEFPTRVVPLPWSFSFAFRSESVLRLVHSFSSPVSLEVCMSMFRLKLVPLGRHLGALIAKRTWKLIPPNSVY